jgi:hypothetical protein
VSDHRIIITDDGNQRLHAIERIKRQMSDNPADFPQLKAEHLMGAPLVGAKDTKVRRQIDDVMPRDLRARAVGAFLFKILRDAHPVLMYDVYLLQRDGFVQLLKETTRPDSLADGLTDKELERAWEIYELNMQILAKRGATLRKRKDWR